MRWRRWLVCGVLATVILTGCSNESAQELAEQALIAAPAPPDGLRLCTSSDLSADLGIRDGAGGKMFTGIRLTNISAASCGLPLDLEFYAEGLEHVPGATSYQPREGVVPRSYPIANDHTDPVIAPANAVVLTFTGASFLADGGPLDDVVLEFLTIRFPDGGERPRVAVGMRTRKV